MYAHYEPWTKCNLCDILKNYVQVDYNRDKGVTYNTTYSFFVIEVSFLGKYGYVSDYYSSTNWIERMVQEDPSLNTCIAEMIKFANKIRYSRISGELEFEITYQDFKIFFNARHCKSRNTKEMIYKYTEDSTEIEILCALLNGKTQNEVAETHKISQAKVSNIYKRYLEYVNVESISDIISKNNSYYELLELRSRSLEGLIKEALINYPFDESEKLVLELIESDKATDEIQRITNKNEEEISETVKKIHKYIQKLSDECYKKLSDKKLPDEYYKKLSDEYYKKLSDVYYKLNPKER